MSLGHDVQMAAGHDPKEPIVGKRRMAGSTNARQRRCVATRTTRDEADLIRFVAGPDSDLVADLKRNLPGRGVWVSANRVTVQQAVDRKIFAQALKSPVRVRQDLADHVAGLMRQALLGRLGLARKAGQAVTGFAKVEGAIKSGKARIVLTASDGADDGRRKIQGILKRATKPGQEPLKIEMFSHDELGLAFGQTNVIHAAVLRGSAGESFLDAAKRLLRYEGNAADIIAQDGSGSRSPDQAVSVRQAPSEAAKSRAVEPQGSTE